MALVLSFVKLPTGVSLPTTTHTFDESGGSIGRGDGNELTLPDPDRFLSSKHCHISCEGGQYYVSDTSTNGTFVNGAHEALGRGGKFALHDGNTLELGDYQFKVGVGGQPSLDIPPAAPVASTGLDDPFATDVFASASASMPNAPLDDDPFSTPFAMDEFESISPSLKPTESLPSFDDDPFSAPALNINNANIDGTADPLAALDGANYGGSPLADQRAPLPKGFGSELDDFLGEAPIGAPIPPASSVHSGKTLGDNLDPLAQSVSWPEPGTAADHSSGNAGGSVIPDDWDDLLGVDEPLASAPTGFSSPEAKNVSPPIPDQPVAQPIPDEDSWGWDDIEKNTPSLEESVPPQHTSTEAGFGDDLGVGDANLGGDASGIDDLGIIDNVGTPPPLGGAFDGKASDAHRSMPLTEPPVWPSETPQSQRPASVSTPQRPKPAGAFKSPVPPRPPVDRARSSVEQTSSEQTTSSKTTGVSDAALINELLSRMGLSVEQLDEAQKSDVCLAFADLIPVVVSGMMQVLRSRASIKNEFRMNVTTIQPVENNPLKFSATAAEAMEKMFVRTTSAYKRPTEAFQEGFDGISEHQVAIIAGIRAAFKSIMQGFDPAILEKQFERQARGIGLPGMQKARYWSSYVDYYQNFVDDMENSFQHLFGDEFVDAYEEQLRTLAAERKNKRM